MTDTQSQLINLLKRLSVVAPERVRFLEADARFLMVFAGVSAFGWRSATQPTDDPGIKPEFIHESLPHILYAVLEEAEARGWEWSLAWSFDMDANTPARRAHRLYPRNYDYFTLQRPIAETMEPREGGILEREVLPRLSCLVLAIESQS